MRLKKTFTEQMQDLVAEYRAAGHAWPARSKDIARWAIKHGKWARHGNALVNLCAREISKAMRDEFYTDPQGRRVRTKHAARFTRQLDDGSDKQEMLWEDVRFAPPQFMSLAFKGRRKQIVGDCRQLKIDVDSYNDNGPEHAPIRMLFDFTNDVIEAEMEETFIPAPIDPALAAIVGGSSSKNI